jgi:hypothetical protein
VNFFDPKVPAEEPEHEYVREPWLERPRGWVGGRVGARLQLARTAETLVVVHDLEAYPAGFSLQVTVRGFPADHRAGMGFHAITTPEWHAGRLAPEFFRFGVQLPNGRRATNLDQARGLPSGPPAELALQSRSSSGGGDSVALEFWIWPLPAAGPVTFVCEWPHGSIEETRAQLDASGIVAAARRARPYLGCDA